MRRREEKLSPTSSLQSVSKTQTHTLTYLQSQTVGMLLLCTSAMQQNIDNLLLLGLKSHTVRTYNTNICLPATHIYLMLFHLITKLPDSQSSRFETQAHSQGTRAPYKSCFLFRSLFFYASCSRPTCTSIPCVVYGERRENIFSFGMKVFGIRPHISYLHN